VHNALLHCVADSQACCDKLCTLFIDGNDTSQAQSTAGTDDIPDVNEEGTAYSLVYTKNMYDIV
jgi:hypothetical protein